MPKNNKPVINGSVSTVYYIALCVQRVSLLLAAAATIFVYINLVVVSYSLNLLVNLKSAPLEAIQQLSDGATTAINKYGAIAAVLSAIALLLTVFMYKFPRVRNFDKKLVINGAVIASFCFVFAVKAEAIYKFVLERTV